ncbi:MAG: hypothetical protein ACREQ7_12740 [Candidatus Binatia bacterium]
MKFRRIVLGALVLVVWPFVDIAATAEIPHAEVGDLSLVREAQKELKLKGK